MMPHSLSQRKKIQIKRFFKSAKKESALAKNALHMEGPGRNWVLLADVEGKKRVIKPDPEQRETREVLNRILDRHKRAVKLGLIKPKYYEMIYKNPYVYADKNVGVMDYIEGVSPAQLKIAINSNGAEGPKIAREICAKNPSLTEHQIDLVFDEFVKHYSTLLNQRESQKKKLDILFDLRSHNLRIVGVNPKTHLPQIMIFDALGPSDARHVREGLGFNKKRRLLFDMNWRIVRKDS